MANFLEIFYKSKDGRTEGVLITENVKLDPSSALPEMEITHVIVKQGKITPEAQLKAYLALFPENLNDD